MIRRGPNPQGNFQILPNATSRDRRLSFRARGLLALMLSYPEDFTFNRDWLARQSDQDGVAAVRGALTELEKAGYLVRRKVRINGKFGWEQILYRTAQPVEETAGESSGGLPADGNPAAGEPPCKEDGHEDFKQDESDMSPRSQTRAADANLDDDDGPSWRDEDRELFGDLVVGSIRSDGRRWNKGVFPGESLYNALRMNPRTNVKWPGRWIQQIQDRGMFEDWLIDEGLTLVQQR